MIQRPAVLSNRPIVGPFLGEDWLLVTRTLTRDASGRTVLGSPESRAVRGSSDRAVNVRLPDTGSYAAAELVLYLPADSLVDTPLATHEVSIQSSGGASYRVLAADDDRGAVRLAAHRIASLRLPETPAADRFLWGTSPFPWAPPSP